MGLPFLGRDSAASRRARRRRHGRPIVAGTPETRLRARVHAASPATSRSGSRSRRSEREWMPAMREIYADHAATTRPGARSGRGDAPYLGGALRQSPPRCTRRGEARARARSTPRALEVAALIGAYAEEIVFTASGSEANNLALKGVLLSARAGAPPARDLGDRAPVGARDGAPPRGARLSADRRARRRERRRRSRATRGRARPRRRAGRRDVGQQRDRQPPAGRRARATLAHAAGALLPLRRRAGGRQAADRRARRGGRSADRSRATSSTGPPGAGGAVRAPPARGSCRWCTAGSRSARRRAGTENLAAIVGLGRRRRARARRDWRRRERSASRRSASGCAADSSRACRTRALNGDPRSRGSARS